jgi:hypothetical protein
MMATAPLRSAPLRAKLALIRGHGHGGRATIFRNHRLGTAGNEPDFATLAALPDWIALKAEEQVRMAKAVAVLMHRPAIDQLLSGRKLAALSDAVGEALFDELSDFPLPANITATVSDSLPRPEDLETIGRAQMLAAIPSALALQYPGAAGDSQASALCAIAAHLLNETKMDA